MLFRSTKATGTPQAVNSSVTFNNSGQVTLNGATGLFALNGAGSDTGDYTVNAGATLDLGAIRTWGATTDVNGAGVVNFVSGTTNVNGTYSIAGTGTTGIGGVVVFNTGGAVVFTNPVSMVSGSLGGSDNVTTNGFFWSGGTVAGSGTLTLNGTTTISGQVDAQRAVANSGTVDVTGGGRLNLSNGADRKSTRLNSSH